MTDLVQYQKKVQQAHIRHNTNESYRNTTTEPNVEQTTAKDTLGACKLLCTHDGVLLKKISAEHIADLNTSGSLSLVEYTNAKRLYLEWKPNESILIADDSQDQGEWALVDTISQRIRTTSESRAFNCRAENSEANNNSTASGSVENMSAMQQRVILTALQELSSIIVTHRGQTLRCIRRSDASVHSEYFFQHGNAELFVRSMRQLHIIECAPSAGKHMEEYIVLNRETQKLKKTFAELDIGEIKASNIHSESWLPSKVVGFLVNIPEYVQPPFQRGALKTRPASFENYHVVDNMLTPVHNSAESSKRSSSFEKSACDELETKFKADLIHMLPKRELVTRGAPLNETQWLEFLTLDGRILEEARVREIIFRGGIEQNLRCEVWKYLLQFYKWQDTAVERLQSREQKSREYYTMKAQWLSMTAAQEANFSGYHERKCQIEKDVKRTDRTTDFFAGEENPNLVRLQGILMTYVMYNFDLGYVQGMSDLLAPILTIQENEVDAFWCFVGFMDMLYGNFDIDQAGIKSQFNQMRCILEIANPKLLQHMVTQDSDNMYFCFRWLLVWFKREFSHDDVLRLWEVLWTGLPCPNFHLFISVAILDQQANTIIAHNYEFTEILKHVNELSEHIDLEQTLVIAEAIYRQLKSVENLPNKIRAIIGEPLLETSEGENSTCSDQADFEDAFDDLVEELTEEEKKRKEELLEEACERSIFLQYT